MEKLNELREAFYPQYGTHGSRDMDVTARRKVIDENIEAVAEAFRALEQRAEAAEAKLAELATQNPRYQIQKKPSYGRESVWIDVASQEEAEANVIRGYRWRMVYDAPAPAADLADLVPDEMPTSHIYHGGNGAFNAGKESGWNACRAAMLRNIEEAQ